MAKLTLTDIQSGYNSNSSFNNNNTLIENAIENTLSRDGTGPNTMGAELDMNSNKIVNLAAPTSPNDAARFIDIATYSTGVNGVSFTNSNGFTGLVVNPTTLPDISIGTSISGVLKGNGVAISAASPTTDYVSPGSYATRSNLTLNTGRLLGRTSASSGAAEEISVGVGLALSGGSLINTFTGGTVTNVSMVNGNGFSGVITNPTTTPELTLSTSVTGILSGNGTAISAASTTGSGDVVLSTTPTLVTPILGVATATTINGCTLTSGTLNGSVTGTNTGDNAINSTSAALAGSASQEFATSTAAQGSNTTLAASTAFVINEFGRHENLVVNPGFTINNGNAGVPYVSAAVLASGEYGHEMWKAGSGGGDYSFTQLASDTTITIASGKTLIQVIEDKHVQFTSYILAWDGTAQARYAVNSATPAGSYAASPITITGQTVGTTMSIEFNTGTLGNVRLSNSPSCNKRSYQQELALSQRYFEVLGKTSQAAICNRGYNSTGNVTYSYCAFSEYKRATPTMAAVGTFTVSNTGQPGFYGISPHGFQLTNTITTTDAFYCLSETTAYVTASSRL